MQNRYDRVFDTRIVRPDTFFFFKRERIERIEGCRERNKISPIPQAVIRLEVIGSIVCFSKIIWA